MIGAFKFNGTESSEFDLVCKSIKRPLLPEMKVKRLEITGASGAYDFDDHEYGLRSVTMRITYIGTDFEELRTRARDIAAWLSTPDFGQLIINDEDDKYYLAKVTSEIDLSSVLEAGEAEIIFDCQPYAYSIEEVTETFEPPLSYPLKFEHLGTRVVNYRSPQGSKSQLEITGSWTTLSITMNGDTLTFSQAQSGKTLLIDNIEMEVTIASVNKFNYLGGAIDTFLSINPGDNSLTISGTGVSLTSVVVKYIPLWI